MKDQSVLEENKEGLPPIFSTWKQLYTILVAYLIVLIILFYWFTISYK